MKRVLALVAACVVISGLYFILRRPVAPSHESSENPDSEALQPPASSNPVGGNLSRTNYTLAVPAGTNAVPIPRAADKPATPFILGSASAPPAMNPDVVLGNMRNIIHLYSSMFGANPIGTNPEITEALNGGNPKEARFINEESGLRINGRGELVDSWGTPFFFHQLSETEMEIRSAGPDMKMWTRDDLITK